MLKKILLSLMVTTFILGGTVLVSKAQHSGDNKDSSNVINVAGGEKEPGLFSSYSTYSVKVL